MNRDFKGIWIPKEIWLDKDLTMQEKLFLVEIDSLDNDKGCFASNKYFSDFFGISITRVSLVIKSLIQKGKIVSKIKYKEGTKQILNRVLNKCYIPPLTKVKDPIQQKLKDNNTVNNTITNNTQKSNIEESFEVFWNLYQKKTDRKKTFTKWKNLSETKRKLAIEAIPAYVKSTPDIQYRKHPTTWINGECWEDEIKTTNTKKKISINFINND
jgi:DNA-binding transcriptional regulator GbsR (MarR family)